MPRLFITGISGFIGSHVAEEAVRQGYTVTGIDIKRPARKTGAKVMTCDIRDFSGVKRAMGRADYVIHLAAITSNVEFDKNPYDSYDTNVNGFRNVIEAAAEAGCKAFVYASSAAVYTDRQSGFSEDVNIDVKRQRNHYAKTKIMNEMMADSYSDIFKLRTIGLRYFNVYGPGENEKGNYASIISIFMKMRRQGKPLTIYGNGKQSRDLIYVKDVAKLTLKALKLPTSTVCNIGTGKSTDYNFIARVIGGKTRYVPNPLSSYQLFTKSDNTRQGKLFGKFRFVPVEEGIKSLLG